MFVMNEQVTLGDTGGIDYLAVSVRPHHDPLLVTGAETDGLFMLEIDPVLGATFLARKCNE